jgi:hypothetical protein
MNIHKLRKLITQTLSPIAKIISIHVLSTLVAQFDYEIHQLDVKPTFFNGYLDEDIYIYIYSNTKGCIQKIMN